MTPFLVAMLAFLTMRFIMALLGAWWWPLEECTVPSLREKNCEDEAEPTLMVLFPMLMLCAFGVIAWTPETEEFFMSSCGPLHESGV